MFQFNPFTGTLDLNAGPGSYADDVVEYASKSAFPVPGEQGKLYVDKSTDRAYRWPENGTTINSYREVSASEVTSVAGKTGAVTLGTADIASASVYFDIAGSHPSIDGSYDVWDIDNNGRFRWANSNAAAEGASWTALRWNSNRWELGTYSAFTTWAPLYFHASEAVIPPATGWQAVTGNTQPVPTLQWFSQPTADEITSLHAEDSRLQKQLDEQGGIASSSIQALSENTSAALATETQARQAADSALQQELEALQSEPGTSYTSAAARAITLFDGTFMPDDPAGTALRVGDGEIIVPEVWKPRFRDAFGAAKVDTDSNNGSALNASQLYDASQGRTALKIEDTTVTFDGASYEAADSNGVYTAAAAFRAAISAQPAGSYATLVSGLVPTTQLPPISFQTTRYDGDGVAFSFAPPGTLTSSDSPSAISVTVNGVTQEPGSDYTLDIHTNRVVLLSALPLGDKIVITRPILLPSNSTLTAEQLGALTATSLIDGGSF